MLYVHYQHKILSNGKGLTEFKFSSSAMANKIWGTDFEEIKSFINFIKQIPASDRLYEPNTKIWTLETTKYELLKNLWIKTNKIESNFFIEHKNLKFWAENKPEFEEKPSSADAPSVEDFFYNNAQSVGQPILTAESARMKLVDFLTQAQIQVFENGDLVKSYKLAARKLHPDLNGGDAKAMTELNFLWQQYKQITGV